MKTIGAAIAKSPAAKPSRVFVCGGAYTERVTIDATHAVSLLGGLSCASWSYTGEHAKLTGDTAGVVLTIRDVAAPVRIFDFDVEALAGTDAVTSSIAAFVSKSADVTFRRVKLTARDGKAGAVGGAAVVGVPTPADLSGNPGSGNVGGGEKTCSCTTGGFSTGGKGGDGGGGVSDGQSGKLAMASPSPSTATGAGQLVSDCAGGTNSARAGSNAPVAINAVPGTVGTLDAQGWKPSDGAKGGDAIPGQGGGGGGGQPGGGGGAGACGGCGGGGGGGGRAGGSSIALLAFEATIHVAEAQLVAGAAQKGGPGVGGAIGQDGGTRGIGAGTACNGANGGKGGTGGAGAGGGGGTSTGVLSQGGAIDLDAQSQAGIQIGTAGTGGSGGAPPTNDGKPGKAAPVLTTSQL